MTNCEVGTEGDIESDGENEVAEVKLHGFAGMGDVIGKILDKTIPNKSNVILCKSKKSKKRKTEAKEEHDAKKEKQEKLAESRELNHVIPAHRNSQKEVILKRTATKGVVKLLNAVSQHQKTVSERMKEERTEAGKDKVADKVTKSDFMELLKKKPTEKQKKKVSEKQDVKDEDTEDSADKKWSVLREDFMMGSSFKDWDKVQSENENEEEESDGDDEDSSTDDEKG